MIRFIHNPKFNVRRSIFIIFIGFTLFACGYSDPFYGKGSGWDYVRFPLIKPYYAISSSGDAAWIIHLENERPLSKVPFLFDIVGVEKISVTRNVIMAYTPNDTKYGYDEQNKQELHWFILIPDEHLEIGFETENEFLDYIRQNNLSEPKWLEPLIILQKYDQTGCLDWIPDCK
jgi:hypothetical protein